MSILSSADQSSSFISVSQLMIVRTSPLPLVRWLFPVKKETEGLISPSFAETLWKLTKLVGRGQRQKRGSLPNNFKEHLNLQLQTIPCRKELIVIHPDITPNVAFAALLFFFFFHFSSLPDLLSEIKLTVGEVSHDLTQLVRTFRWVNCFTDFTVSNTGEVKSSNFCQDSEALENSHTIN